MSGASDNKYVGPINDHYYSRCRIACALLSTMGAHQFDHLNSTCALLHIHFCPILACFHLNACVVGRNQVWNPLEEDPNCSEEPIAFQGWHWGTFISHKYIYFEIFNILSRLKRRARSLQLPSKLAKWALLVLNNKCPLSAIEPVHYLQFITLNVTNDDISSFHFGVFN
jgi:hypothetical protein